MSRIELSPFNAQSVVLMAAPFRVAAGRRNSYLVILTLVVSMSERAVGYVLPLVTQWQMREAPRTLESEGSALWNRVS
jgi:hypothetical protein